MSRKNTASVQILTKGTQVFYTSVNRSSNNDKVVEGHIYIFDSPETHQVKRQHRCGNQKTVRVATLQKYNSYITRSDYRIASALDR